MKGQNGKKVVEWLASTRRRRKGKKEKEKKEKRKKRKKREESNLGARIQNSAAKNKELCWKKL